MDLTSKESIEGRSFPFLELPTELKKEIYNLLLDGRVIHIDYPGGKTPAQYDGEGREYTCESAIADSDNLAMHNQSAPPGSDMKFVSDIHRECWKPVDEVIELNMLLVCH